MICPKCGAKEGEIDYMRWRNMFLCNSSAQIGDRTNFYQSDECKLTCANKRIKELEDALEIAVGIMDRTNAEYIGEGFNNKSLQTIEGDIVNFKRSRAAKLLEK